MMRTFVLSTVVGLAAGFASAQSRTISDGNIMVPDSTNDRVMLFDSFDGSLMNSNFIDLVPAGGMTPINAVQVGEEIWISDQVADSIFRYSIDGSTQLGTITGGLDNIRGIEWVGNTVYVTNAGSNNGAPGQGIVTIDVGTETINGFFITGSNGAGNPFDVLDYFGNLLINDIAENEIDTYTRDGAFVSNFHDSDGSTGINFPEQMTRTSMGNILAGGFGSPSGIYEYDNAGNQINYWDVDSSVRGVLELGNGNILFTDSSGVYVLDPNSGAITASITGVSARFAEFVIPAPGTLGLAGLAGLAAFRRRRR